MRPSKKGQISIQFNWIFVIIIGAVFLAFFFTAITSGANSTQNKVHAQMAQAFENQLGVASNEPGVVKIIDDTSSLQIEFTCNQNTNEYNYRIEDGSVQDTKFSALFSSRFLTGSKIIFWSQDWNMPFRISVFTYVTNQDHAYIFYNPSNSLKHQELINNFATNITSFVVNDTTPWPTHEQYNYDRYTYILFAGDDSAKNIREKFISQTGVSSQILVIDESGEVFSHGKISFLTPQQYPRGIGLTELTSSYVGKASLYGAIFSENKQTYECEMNKAFKQLEVQYLLQKYKLEETFPSVSVNCKTILGGGSLPGPYTYIGQLLEYVSDGFTSETVADIYALARSLENENQALQFDSTCPALY